MHWNASECLKDPDTGMRKRRAQRRTRLSNYERVRSGGKARYLLSGLLTCNECGAHYVISGQSSYSCSSYVNGKACSNNVRVRRDQIEKLLLAPVREELLAPKRIERMAREMQRDYAARAKALVARSEAIPQGLQDLDARIARLRDRMTIGDPDMTGDKHQAA